MTLEDFFTLSELKDGLTAITRVEELVAVMQKEKEFPVKNYGDATRQWSTVASTIAATNNKDCLDLFIQSGGLWFIDKWLKDVETFSTDTSDCFVEESISALLLSLEKLQIDGESLVSSGLLVTVGSLLSHKSSSIQDRARALLDSWKQSPEGDGIHLISEKDDVVEVRDKVGEEEGSTLCSGVESHEASEPSQKGAIPSECCNDHQSKEVESPKEEASNITSAHADTEDKCSYVLSSPGKAEPVQNDPSMREEQTCAEETLDPHCSPKLKQKCDEAGTDVDISHHSPKDLMQKNGNANPENGLSKLDISSMSSASVPADASSKVETEDGKESVAKPAAQTDDVDNEKSSMGSTLNEMQIDDSRKGLDNDGALKNCTTALERQASREFDLCGTKSLPESPGNGNLSEKLKDLDKTSSRLEVVRRADKVKGRVRKVKGHMADAYGVVKPKKGSKNPVFSETSDMDLEYGTVDALEVARQVAKEVERQVEDYDERFDSSASEGSSPGGVGLLDSSDSADEDQEEHSEGPLNEQPAIENSSPLASPKVDEHVENLVAERLNGGQDMESSQVTQAAQEPEIHTDRSVCEIDLNLDMCSENADHAVDSISNPVPVVHASRAAAASGMPAPPLQFEGSLGWKGSAATSAFRPASPRDRVVFVGGTSSGSRQRQDSLEIDLNTAEGGDNKNVNAIAGMQYQPLSSLPSGESSVESRRAERPLFDLNLMGEEGDVQHLGLKLGAHLVGSSSDCRSPSPASSSSSMKPPIRNFDLNDRPAIFHEASDRQPFLGQPPFQVDASAGLPDDTVISLMGARVQKGTVPNQIRSFMPFLFGSNPEVPNVSGAGIALGAGVAVPHANSGVGITLGAGVGQQHANSSFYGYNGLVINPGVSYSSAMYGPVPSGSIPYMVNSRGVVPQMLGSSSTMPPPYARHSQPPFPMNLVGGPLTGSNGDGTSRSNLDLNSGFAFEGSDRDHPGGFRQFLAPGLVRPMEEHLMRDNLQPSCSAAGGKRKEPEGGWEPFMTSYKHHQPPPL